MKHVFLMLAFTLSVMGVNAQTVDKDKLEDKKWNLKGVSGLNVSQTAVSNWSAGGENAMAGTVYLNGELLRKSGNWLWSNYMVL